MAKKNKVLVKLVSTVSGTKTGFYYVKSKNPKKKLSLRKYNPVTRQHELFEEKKLSS